MDLRTMDTVAMLAGTARVTTHAIAKDSAGWQGRCQCELHADFAFRQIGHVVVPGLNTYTGILNAIT